MADSFRNVLVKQTGDGRLAVFERSTDEPVQYVSDLQKGGKIAEGWDDLFDAKNSKGHR